MTWSSTSPAGRALKSLRSWARTLLLASRIKGRRFGRMTLTGCGRGESTGRETMDVVR